ncbi:hypothetical protein [Sulfurovum sp. NBC37-1]|uniref:hypothetical protein n=1 Tax=Sulfurovum sp. (strain NBC37-1) TaxID=387093 RepID=UPI000158797E|nr:hypothetical protein [Sulfurovum sp. NBC37-1]BAF73237.1 hypothetical protein SUN_2297 [Sulfurovum sp. NBC37-1]
MDKQVHNYNRECCGVKAWRLFKIKILGGKMIADRNDPLSMADYYTIMRKKGYINGYYGSTSIDKVAEEVKVKLGKALLSAQGVSVLLYMNERMQQSDIENMWLQIEALIHPGASIMLNTETDNGISGNMVEYEVLLSGFHYDN